MTTKRHHGIEAAILSITGMNKNFIFKIRSLRKGEKTRFHYHKEANEWIVVENGSFIVKTENEVASFRNLGFNKHVAVIHIAPKEKHSLEAISRIRFYWVLKDKKDKTIYVKKRRRK